MKATKNSATNHVTDALSSSLASGGELLQSHPTVRAFATTGSSTTSMEVSGALPNSGLVKLVPGTLLRIKQIIPDILPISRSAFWAGVRTGRFPKPVKLGPRVTAWKADDLLALVEKGVPYV